MSTFLSFNTDDPGAGNAPLAANASVTLGPVEAGTANKIAGSCFSDSAGTLWVYGSFDYWASGGQPNATPHWDVVQPAGGQAIAAGTPYTIDFDVIAPVIQVVFTNGVTANNHLRIFLRAYGNRYGG